ncbi:MAG: ATP-dependent DNA ligase [archaeon]
MHYLSLVELYEQLEKTTSRLEKTTLIAKFLMHVSEESLPEVLPLLQGKVFPDHDERKIGVAARIIIKALAIATGYTTEKVEAHWKRQGDLGKAAELLIGKKSQNTLFSSSLTVSKVMANTHKLASMEGAGTVDNKVKLIAELLTSAQQLEAKYIVRLLLEELRIGLGEGTLRDAIVYAYLVKGEPVYDKASKSIILADEEREKYAAYAAAVQTALDLTNDVVAVALAAKDGVQALGKLSMKPGIPVKVMLAQKVGTMEEGLAAVGIPAALEYKYDGFRMQIHKVGKQVKLFTRRLEEVTKQFPEVVKAIEEHVKGDTFILDGEAVGIKDGKYRPFQEVSQRIKRKYDIAEIARAFPVELNIFDILYNGETLLNVPFEKRRALLEGMVSEKKGFICLAKQVRTDSERKAEDFYKQSLAAGNEGIMLKNINGVYKPGSRVGYMVKLKPVMETLDLAIVGAEWGEGKRGKWLASFVLACFDEESGQFKELGKVGTGIKELEAEELSDDHVTFAQLTELLKPFIVQDKGKEVSVQPSIVIEVNYEEIQASPTYTSGFALRFPRVIRLRSDRDARDISTLSFVRELYEKQRHRRN